MLKILKNRVKRRVFFTVLISTIFSLFALYFTFKYTIYLAQQELETEIFKVKQSFSENIKTTETVVQNLQKLVSIVGGSEESKFQSFSDHLIARYSFINSISFYKKVPQNLRSLYEQELSTNNRGATIVESNPQAQDKVQPATLREFYLPLTLADSRSAANSYYGWDLLSDLSKKIYALRALEQDILVGSEAYLLDSGHAAFELYLKVLIDTKENKDTIGLIGLIIDLPNLLGDEEWRKNVTIDLSTVLGKETTRRLLYRSLNQNPPISHVISTIFSATENKSFNQEFSLIFSRDLDLSKINSAILIMALLACFILTLLASYLAKASANLAESLDELAIVNAGLERTVQERTRSLQATNDEINEMLEKLDDAVLVIGHDHKVTNRFSPVTPALLGTDSISGSDIRLLLFKDLARNEDKNAVHFTTLQMLFGADDFQWEITHTNLAKTIPYIHPKFKPDKENRVLSVRYAPLYDDKGQISRILLVVSDLTEMLTLRKELMDQQKQSGSRVKILGELLAANRETLVSFMAEMNERLESIKEATTKLQKNQEVSLANLIFRELHTLKGNARFAGLSGISQIVHEVEDQFSSIKEQIHSATIEDFTQLIEKLDQTEIEANSYRSIYDELFSMSDKDALNPKILSFTLQILRNNTEGKLVAKYLQEQSENSIFSLSDLFLSFEKMCEEVSARLKKRINPLLCEEDLFLRSNLKQPLRDMFTHMIRNSLDHGIENPDLREASGKSAQGKISLTWMQNSEYFSIFIEDDGAGVNTKRVLKIAREKSIAGSEREDLTEGEIIEFLFSPGFSTKDEVSDLSGRGVGLDAVRACAESFSGKVLLYSNEGQGAKFEIRIPRVKVCYFTKHSQLCEAT